MSWQFNLEQAEEGTWRRKTSPDEKIFQEPATKMFGDWRGRDLSGSALVVYQGGKTLPLCHSGLTPLELRGSSATPAWPVALVAHAVMQELPAGRCPFFCGSLLCELRPREMGQVWQEDMYELSTLAWGDSIFMAILLSCLTDFNEHKALCRLGVEFY
jgi:hypothetical protein